MKRFNQEIQVSVEVDTIADMLLNTMAPDSKHRELVTEALIGRMMSQDMSGLSFLYNSLNGYPTTIDFKVGDFVIPTGLQVYGFWTPESIEKNDTVFGDIKLAKVIAINEYADNKLTIEYDVPKKKNGFEKQQRVIHHTKCARVPVDQVVLEGTSEVPAVVVAEAAL